MISSVLALIAATVAAQSDTTRASREAFADCLRGFVDRSIENGTTPEAFETEYPRQCAAQEAAFRVAIIRRETAARASQADAEEMAGLEIEDARLNLSELFTMAAEEHAQAQAEADARAQEQAQQQAQQQAQEAGDPPQGEQPEAPQLR